MESVFPQLFFLSYFSAFVLRIGAAIAVGLIAMHLYKVRSKTATMQFPLIGSPSPLFILLKVGIIGLVAGLLLIGLFTQAAALAGAVIGIKAWFFAKRYPELLPHGQLAYFLLTLLSLFLAVSGSGPFAFDLPY